MSESKNTPCKCLSKSCSRHGNCEACLAYHKKTGTRTSCGKDGKALDNK